MKSICDGVMVKEDVVHQSLEQYREVYARVSQHADVLTQVRDFVFLLTTYSAPELINILTNKPKDLQTIHTRFWEWIIGIQSLFRNIELAFSMVGLFVRALNDIVTVALR